MKCFSRLLVIGLGIGALARPAVGQVSAQLDPATMLSFKWRQIGPSSMMGRVADIVGIPSPSRTFYVASAAGGIWKTTNNGISFRPLFTNERVVSMGHMAIAPSDTNQIWAGTGEDNSRNSISPGQGIYKSMDGGLSWKLMGLEKTQTIGRVVVHPTNPNIVWVAALGAIWNSNPERGLYKTTDGGVTWRLVKFVSDKAGFGDVVIDPSNPNILFASSWERVRGPYFLTSGGPGSALWKSVDGGETWTEVKGGGFPAGIKGRIGLAIAPSDSKVVYALTEADSLPNPTGRPGVGQPARQESGLYRSNDGGATWTRTSTNDTRPFYYSQVRVDPKNPNRVYWSSTPVNFSDDGGTTARTTTNGIHVDHHAMWIDPNDPQRIVVGNDGGVGISFDRGGNWWFPQNFAIGQFYAVSFDNAVPYNICGGLQDNGAWCGPSRRRSGAMTAADWFTFTGGDGFYTQQDPTDPNIIYGESQGGAMGRTNLATGATSNMSKPTARARMLAWRDTIAVLEGDPGTVVSAANKARIAEINGIIAADSANHVLRWNWDTPFILSPHNPATVYAGGNHVLKSLEHGDNFQVISPDLSYADTMKIRVSTRTTGGITTDATGAETYATIVSLAESYVRPGLLYAGTDDGRVWLTRNDGGVWEELTKRFSGVPAGTYVSGIEPSYADTNTFYVTFDNHREGDFTPYVFITRDYGKSFKNITNDLPKGGPDFVHVIREDPANPNVLFVGTDVGAYVSLNKGRSWQKFMAGMPTVPVADLKIQPRERELIAGTHGRSIWIADIAPLAQLTDSVLALPVFLFKPKTATQYYQPPHGGADMGQAYYEATSPPYGADIAYHVGGTLTGAQAQISILDAAGDTVATLTGSGAPGLYHVTWGFQVAGRAAPRLIAQTPAQRRDSLLVVYNINHVCDSLLKTGKDPAAMERIRKLLLNPVALTQNFNGQGGRGGGGGNGGGGRRGGGGGDPNGFGLPVWADRPGEAGGGRGGGGGGGGGGRGGAPPATLNDSIAAAAATGTAATAASAGAARGGAAGRGAGGRGGAAGAAGGRGGRGGRGGAAAPTGEALPNINSPAVTLFAIRSAPDSALGRIVASRIPNAGVFPVAGGAAGGRGGGGGGGGGGRGGNAAAPGDYLVIVRIGANVSKQVLRVERIAGAGVAEGSPLLTGENVNGFTTADGNALFESPSNQEFDSDFLAMSSGEYFTKGRSGRNQ